MADRISTGWPYWDHLTELLLWDRIVVSHSIDPSTKTLGEVQVLNPTSSEEGERWEELKESLNCLVN
jgi:hypothetical protein